MYGELVDMPLVVWAPGRVKAGTVVEETVTLLDVMPTLLGLSRLPAPADVGIHRDGVAVDIRDAAQLEVTRVAPQCVSGGRVAALDLATVTGDHTARHH